MTLDHDPSRPRRTAELRLRAPGGPLEARGYWPAAVWPPLCVTFGVAPGSGDGAIAVTFSSEVCPPTSAAPPESVTVAPQFTG